MNRSVYIVGIVILLCVVRTGADVLASDPPLIPIPKSVKLSAGQMNLTPASRIIAADASLKPLAKVLSGEILLATGFRPAVAGGPAHAGDILLQHASDLEGERYQLNVGDYATVSGGTYTADAWGTVTLLQAISANGTAVTLPRMTVDDRPDMAYRGFMKDVARQYVPMDMLYANVELCRLYKVRYLHLHLSDDHAWTFPSTAYPLLGTRNEGAHSGPAPKCYDLNELKDLVRFADERGVTIVPELEGPGHSGAMRISMPDLFDSPAKPGGSAHLGIMNMASPDVYQAMDTIIGEVADVFKSSPYIHVGCDEVNADAVRHARGYEEFMASHNLKDPGQLFSYYVTQMVSFTKKRGKMPIAWEGVPLAGQSPDDLILMMWTQDCGDAAREYSSRGYRLINAPNGGFSGPREAMEDLRSIGQPELNYTTDLYSFGLAHLVNIGDSTPLVIGAQVNDWESTWDYAAPIARRAVPARDANAWNANEQRDYDAFSESLRSTDALTEKLVEPVTFKNEIPGDIDGEHYIQRLRKHTPFVEPVTVTLNSGMHDASIRYTLDDSIPTSKSAAYSAPLTIKNTCAVSAALFDAQGLRISPVQRTLYDKVEYERSLTTGKPVTASAVEGDCKPSYITDGYATKDIWRGWWGAGPCPQWVQIDLQSVQKVGRIVVVPFWNGRRYYQYKVDVSTDGSDWKQVVDMSNNTEVATPRGHSTAFAPVDARYIRVTVLKNSANPSAHLVEVRAFAS
jgi:hexosaminidase